MTTRTALIDGYNRSAPIYDQVAGATYAGGFWRFVPRLQVGPFPAVLDLACGTGINLLEAARALGPCRRLHGVDLAPGMLREARRKAEAAGVLATFEEGDAEKLALEDGAFDLVICNSAYHWFSNRSRAVAEMSRVLRPGGQVLILGIADPNFEEWVRVVDEVYYGLFRKRRSWLPRLPTPAELMADCRAAGLSVEHLEYEVDSMPVVDAGSFLQTMSVIAPTWLAGVPEQSVAAVARATSAALSADAANPFLVTSAGMACVARKRESGGA